MRRYKWAIVLVCGLLLVARVAISVYIMVDSVPTVAQVNTLPTIIIDPGHGGIDGGAVGVDGIVEKDINLNISLVLRDLLVANGFEVVMTRDTDISIHDEGVTGTKRQKISDIHNRLAMTKEYPGCIFISVHQNKFGESSSHGTQIFYGPQNPGSDRLADILQQTVVDQLQPNNKRQRKKAGKNLYIMTNAECPAILMECGFLSNSTEAHQLIESKYQSQLAFVAFQAVMQYLELDTPGNTVAEPQPALS